MNAKTLAIGGILIVVIGVIGYQMGRGSGDTAMAPLIDMEGLDDPNRLVELAQGTVLGDENAPVTIIEFGDYQCPGCMGFNQSVKPQIDLSYIQTGDAKFIYYDYPLGGHPYAFLAARAARCAGDQELYWQYHDEIFANQPSWSSSPTAPIGDFVDYAVEVGADEDEFESCLRSHRHAEVVTANFALAQQLGVGGTPTVIVSLEGGPSRRVADNSFAAIRSAIEELRAEAAAEAGAADTTTAGGTGR